MRMTKSISFIYFVQIYAGVWDVDGTLWISGVYNILYDYTRKEGQNMTVTLICHMIIIYLIFYIYYAQLCVYVRVVNETISLQHWEIWYKFING